MSEGQLPTKPTSGTWREDAEALLSMGAKSIDAATVRGLIAENVDHFAVGHRAGVSRAIAVVEAWAQMQQSVATAKDAFGAPCSADNHEQMASLASWVAMLLARRLNVVAEGDASGPFVVHDELLRAALEEEREAVAELKGSVSFFIAENDRLEARLKAVPK